MADIVEIYENIVYIRKTLENIKVHLHTPDSKNCMNGKIFQKLKLPNL